MDSDQIARRDRYYEIAKSLKHSSDLYLKAIKSIESNPEDPSYYQWIREANLLIDAAFPEKFQAHKVPQHPLKKSSAFDWGVFLKILIPILVVLGVLLFTVFSGTTGDMTKSWNTDEITKNAQYPKSNK